MEPRQIPLFDGSDLLVPITLGQTLARRSDPPTSHQAARRLTQSGRLNAQCQQVYAALVKFPNNTSAELAEAAGLDRFLVARRLPDLAKLGRAQRGPARQCRVKKTQAITWIAQGEEPIDREFESQP